jgi:isocitrate dehydrogenase (NAD+)
MLVVTLIPGDGVGPEVATAARTVIDHVTDTIRWDVVEAGLQAYKRHGRAVPAEVIESLTRTRLGLKGPMTVPETGYGSPNTEIRSTMGLWCNIRRARHIPGCRKGTAGTDIVIVRDVTEDLGRGAEQMVGENAGIGIKFVTRAATERLARYAMSYAADRGLTRVTVPNQAPTNRSTDGLFLATVMEEARNHPALRVEGEAMDALAMHLVSDPREYELLLCQNFYGGILGGLCAGLAGGVGLMAGVNLDGAGAAVFEAGHGSVPKYAKLSKVNPAAMILSGAMLLDHIGESEAAELVESAVVEVISDGQHVTYDLGGSASTTEMTDAVRRAIDRETQQSARELG